MQIHKRYFCTSNNFHGCDISVGKKHSLKNHYTMIHIELFYIESWCGQCKYDILLKITLKYPLNCCNSCNIHPWVTSLKTVGYKSKNSAGTFINLWRHRWWHWWSCCSSSSLQQYFVSTDNFVSRRWDWPIFQNQIKNVITEVSLPGCFCLQRPEVSIEIIPALSCWYWACSKWRNSRLYSMFGLCPWNPGVFIHRLGDQTTNRKHQFKGSFLQYWTVPV